MDLVCARGDDTPVLLATYRNVSQYHGAQVRQGVMVVRVADTMRLGAIKVPAGAVAVDGQGRIWAGDVAGHVGVYSRFGTKQLALPGSPKPAVPDAQLAKGTPLPARIRTAGKREAWALRIHSRNLVCVEAEGATGVKVARTFTVPKSTGVLKALYLTDSGPVVIGAEGIWRPDGK